MFIDQNMKAKSVRPVAVGTDVFQSRSKTAPAGYNLGNHLGAGITSLLHLRGLSVKLGTATKLKWASFRILFMRGTVRFIHVIESSAIAPGNALTLLEVDVKLRVGYLTWALLEVIDDNSLPSGLLQYLT